MLHFIILVAADWHYVVTEYVGLLRLLLQLPNVCPMIDPLVLEKVPFYLGLHEVSVLRSLDWTNLVAGAWSKSSGQCPAVHAFPRARWG